MRTMISPRAAAMAAFKPVETIRPGLLITRNCACRLAASSRYARVPSVDIPSAAMISMPPSGGIWARMDWIQGSMCPASFRHGITTETNGGADVCMVVGRFINWRLDWVDGGLSVSRPCARQDPPNSMRTRGVSLAEGRCGWLGAIFIRDVVELTALEHPLEFSLENLPRTVVGHR